MNDQIIQGDTLEVLKTLESESIDMTITSPPYWGLRDYGVKGQLGLEPDFNDFLKKMWAIYDEIKRVLKKDGTCWINFGDTYGGNKQGKTDLKYSNETKENSNGIDKKAPGFTKCLLMIPERFALGMIDRGWILRNKIIWNKPNHMPSSVKDRFSNSWEYIYFFSKSKKYYFDLDAVREKHKTNLPVVKKQQIGTSQEHKKDKWGSIGYGASGKNPGDSWTITTQPFPEAHFAVFPEKLAERPIKTTPRWICDKCNKPRVRITKTGKIIPTGHGGSKKWTKVVEKYRGKKSTETSCFATGGIMEKHTTGWTKCNCNAGFHPAVILDPFMGSGTTAVVAKKLGRHYLGIELNPKYIEIAKRRIQKVPVRLDMISNKEG